MLWPSTHQLLVLGGSLTAIAVSGLILTLWLCIGREDDDFWAGVDADRGPFGSDLVPGARKGS